MKINYKISGKSVTSLIGPSCCGKSTFLRSINRMNDLERDFNHCGRISIDDEDIYDGDVDIVDLRKKVGGGISKS